jgi:hypothetical protein
MKICDYGCGKEGKHQFKNGKWCCSESHNSCESKKERSITGNSGKHKRSIDFCKQMSNLKRGFKHTEKSLIKIRGPRRKIEKIKNKYIEFSKMEEMRYNPENIREIQVHCKNSECINSKENLGWFTPTGRQLECRIAECEKGNKKGFIYCSKKCKIDDPDFHKKIDLETRKNFLKYRRLVDRYTNISIKKYGLINIELRGRKQGFSLDHKYSVWDGFINNIEPKIIGHIKNLKIIKINENSVKHKKSEIKIEELLKEINSFKKEDAKIII